jgi:4-hydroxyphenylpyruvate dioxygenase
MLRGIDHIEFYVGNAFASAYFFTRALGFRPLAEAGLETGLRDRQSFAVEQGEIRIVFTNALTPDGPIAEHARVHGDGIYDVALAVDDAERAFRRAVELGAEPVAEPHDATGDGGRVRRAAVRSFGGSVHSLVERDGSAGAAFLPGFRPTRSPAAGRGASLTAIDHVAVCVDAGTLSQWVEFYRGVFGFHEAHHEDIVTERSAMNSKVMESENGTIKFPIMEPAPGRGKSQIDEYLDYHHGPGAQHLAMLSGDIVATVRAWREGGVNFLQTPGTYYDALPGRVGEIKENIRELRELNVLVDRDRWGYLLQVFSKPVTGRPTGFLEVVQRRGARGFGAGNVRALFEAVEREQAARGNL